MDPRYMDTLENNTFSIALLHEKNCEIKEVRSQPIESGQFAEVCERTRLGGEISSEYYIRKLINNTQIFVEEY